MRGQINPQSPFGLESFASRVHLLARRVFLWAALGLLAVLAFVAQPTRAAVAEAWVQRYNSPANSYDEALAMAVDGSGNVVVTGYSDGGFYTAKYAAADGALLWEKRYGSGIAYAVAVDGSGNVVVTGNAATRNGWDYYTVKYAAADGALLWEQRYDGPDNSDDLANAVAVDGSGNVIVTGTSYNSSGVPDYYTVKYASADGALLWEQRYNGPANGEDEANAVTVDGSDNVVVTGTSYNATNADYYTAKYAAADGALIWEQRYNGKANGHDFPAAMAVDGQGDVVVTGFASGSSYTAKYAALDGALIWEQQDPAAGNRARALAIDARNNVVTTGESRGTNGFLDCYTVKYAGHDGRLLWARRYDGPAGRGDNGNAVAVDADSNVIVTGSSGGGPGDNVGVYTAKYAAADGALIWEHRYSSPTNMNVGLAVAATRDGDVAVTGYSTLKYAGATGTLMWQRRYDTNDLSIARAIAVDTGGNVVVTGTVGPNNDYDYYTAKYASGDGTLVWEKRYNGPNRYDYALAMKLDGNGNAVVTGTSTGDWGNTDYYTAKYAAADGALLWEMRYNGPANTNDVVPTSNCLALGRNGVVAVTGNSAADSGYVDYATVVYWENLPPVTIEVTGNAARLRFTGLPGRTYEVQRAGSLAGRWSTIATLTAPGNGSVEHVDAKFPSGLAFYRVVSCD